MSVIRFLWVEYKIYKVNWFLSNLKSHGIKANINFFMATTTIIGDKKLSTTFGAKSSIFGEPYRTTLTHGGGGRRSSSHHSFQTTLYKLNVKNYLKLAQSVKLAINGRGKL